MSHMGDSSYSLYLFHPFVLGLIPLAARVLSVHTAWEVALLVSGACAMAAMCSYAIYAFVERPLTEGLRRLVL